MTTKENLAEPEFLSTIQPPSPKKKTPIKTQYTSPSKRRTSTKNENDIGNMTGKSSMNRTAATSASKQSSFKSKMTKNQMDLIIKSIKGRYTQERIASMT